MTPEQIRGIKHITLPGTNMVSIGQAAVTMTQLLQELTAQVAELNEFFRNNFNQQEQSIVIQPLRIKIQKTTKK